MAHNFVVIFIIIKQEKWKAPAEQRSPSHTSPLAPYAIVSSKAQVPNLNNVLEAFPTFATFLPDP